MRYFGISLPLVFNKLADFHVRQIPLAITNNVKTNTYKKNVCTYIYIQPYTLKTHWIRNLITKEFRIVWARHTSTRRILFQIHLRKCFKGMVGQIYARNFYKYVKETARVLYKKGTKSDIFKKLSKWRWKICTIEMLCVRFNM